MWFSSYLKGRSQYVEINTKRSRISNTNTGVPQGSVLGPLMYTLYINELPNILKDKSNCKDSCHEIHDELFGKNCQKCPEIPCYADDATVISSSNSRITNQNNLSEHLEKICKYLNTNHLVINKEKTTINEIMTRQKRIKTAGAPPKLTVPDKNGNLKNYKSTTVHKTPGY